mgnify:CR=1 FL=1
MQWVYFFWLVWLYENQYKKDKLKATKFIKEIYNGYQYPLFDTFMCRHSRLRVRIKATNKKDIHAMGVFFLVSAAVCEPV